MAQAIQRRFFKFITGEIVFGEFEAIDTENGQQVLIKKPYTIVGGQAIPYMYNIIGEAPKQIAIHPINILWSEPLDEFEVVYDAYIKATSEILKGTQKQIITGL